MAVTESTRRKFLKFLGLTAGASLVGAGSIAGIVEKHDVRSLKPAQQKFMIEYGKWMDEFIEVIHIQKSDPANQVNQKKMIALTERAENFKPALKEYMQDKDFVLIYSASIERMKNVI